MRATYKRYLLATRTFKRQWCLLLNRLWNETQRFVKFLQLHQLAICYTPRWGSSIWTALKQYIIIIRFKLMRKEVVSCNVIHLASCKDYHSLRITKPSPMSAETEISWIKQQLGHIYSAPSFIFVVLSICPPTHRPKWYIPLIPY